MYVILKRENHPDKCMEGVSNPMPASATYFDAVEEAKRLEALPTNRTAVGSKRFHYSAWETEDMGHG